VHGRSNGARARLGRAARPEDLTLFIVSCASILVTRQALAIADAPAQRAHAATAPSRKRLAC
jgi:hypothetical protein